MKRFYVGVVLALGIGSVTEPARAEWTWLVPTATTASSEYPGMGVERLFDGSITPADVGGSANIGADWACDGSTGDTSPTVAMDFGVRTSFAQIAYTQRGGDFTDSVDLWFSDSPFSATYPATLPAAPAAETITLTHAGYTTLLYGFENGPYTGQYVLARFNSSYTPYTGNPGGYEMRLVGQPAPIPEPSALMLLGCGLLGLLAYAWRKRK